MAGFRLMTSNGYDFWETTSALQKSIRRGQEKEALFWSFELAGKFDGYLWRRLAVIASEDIGIADSSISMLIDTLWTQYFELKQHDPSSTRLILGHAILALCRAKKSRIVDNLVATVYLQREAEGLRLEIPDEALDQHTQRGKRLGRGLEHWAENGCQLANEAEGLDIYRDEALALRRQHWHLRGTLQKARQEGRTPARPSRRCLMRRTSRLACRSQPNISGDAPAGRPGRPPETACSAG